MLRLSIFLALWFSTTTSTQASEQVDLAITNVTVVDAVSPPQENRTVLILGDQIVAVTEGLGSYKPGRVIDGAGQYLIPGLWDMHVHIVYEQALIDAMPDLFLDYGITSVRDTGALLHKIQPEVKRWHELGSKAPDLYFSGPLLDGSLVVYDGDGRPEIGMANPSVEQALDNFNALRAAGVDFIKIYELVSPEVFAALADAAKQADLPIAAHVPLSMSAETAGPRVGSMEHVRNVEIGCAQNANELFELRRAEIVSPGERTGYELRRSLHQSQRTSALESADASSERCQKVLASLVNTIQVPTLRLNTITQYSPARRHDWVNHLERLPQPLGQNWLATAKFYAGQTSELGNRMSEWSLEVVAAMLDAGVPVGAGTDTPIAQAIPGYSLHTELERLVDAGMTPRQALEAATIRPAEFFSMDDKGQIKVGMEADLVLLEKNPLENIRHTRTIVNVIANGEVVR